MQLLAIVLGTTAINGHPKLTLLGPWGLKVFGLHRDEGSDRGLVSIFANSAFLRFNPSNIHTSLGPS